MSIFVESLVSRRKKIKKFPLETVASGTIITCHATNWLNVGKVFRKENCLRLHKSRAFNQHNEISHRLICLCAQWNNLNQLVFRMENFSSFEFNFPIFLEEMSCQFATAQLRLLLKLVFSSPPTRSASRLGKPL